MLSRARAIGILVFRQNKFLNLAVPTIGAIGVRCLAFMKHPISNGENSQEHYCDSDNCFNHLVVSMH